MTRVIGKLGDRLLGVVLKEDRAGACVPEHGTKCVCLNNIKYVYNCNGICVKDGKCY